MKQQFKTGFRAVGAIVGATGIALAPLAASAATESQNTTVNAVISSMISMTTSGTVNINITPVSGGSQTSASDTVTVNSNHSAGYTLAVKDADATLTLTKGTDTIAASANTFASSAVLANNTWGWAVPDTTTGCSCASFDSSYAVIPNQTSSSTTWAGMTATDQVFKSTTTVASNDITTVWYSAKADTSKPNGTYANIVTYTATTK